MTVKELIQLLKKKPQHLQVAYSKYSEYCLIEVEDIEIQTHCEVRDDGWIQRSRPDKPQVQYLMFPGN